MENILDFYFIVDLLVKVILVVHNYEAINYMVNYNRDFGYMVNFIKELYKAVKKVIVVFNYYFQQFHYF